MSQTLGMERNDCMNGRKRKVQIKFYVTEEERALIEQKMKLVPTQNMAAYLRKIAIDGYIIGRPRNREPHLYWGGQMDES